MMSDSYDTAPSSWTSNDPCPPWCTSEHREDEHPEDCAHYSSGVCLPVVVPNGSPFKDEGVTHGDFIVGVRKFKDQTDTWVFIGDGKDVTKSIEVSLESARRLCRCLSSVLGEAGSSPNPQLR